MWRCGLLPFLHELVQDDSKNIQIEAFHVFKVSFSVAESNLFVLLTMKCSDCSLCWVSGAYIVLRWMPWLYLILLCVISLTFSAISKYKCVEEAIIVSIFCTVHVRNDSKLWFTAQPRIYITKNMAACARFLFRIHLNPPRSWAYFSQIDTSCLDS